jgi:hypothetical protein
MKKSGEIKRSRGPETFTGTADESSNYSAKEVHGLHADSSD